MRDADFGGLKGAHGNQPKHKNPEFKREGTVLNLGRNREGAGHRFRLLEFMVDLLL
jgi:hypothetical protein